VLRDGCIANLGRVYDLIATKLFHPLLKRINNLSKEIVKFRSKNGSIQNLEILRDSMILNIAEYNRLKPYFCDPEKMRHDHF